MNGKHKKKLIELNGVCEDKKKTARSDSILLFIAELTAETNGNVKWLLWMACAAAIFVVGILITLVIRGL